MATPSRSTLNLLSHTPIPTSLSRTSTKTASSSHPRSFSSTSSSQYPRDRNPNRGVSALRRTGLRQPLSVSKYPLPQPVLDAGRRSSVETDDNHGLWGFFGKEKKALTTPEEDVAHGRSWTVEELRHKSWEDLHRLWWICAKERNRIATSSFERNRLGAGYGDYEASQRDETVRKTQRAVKHALTERWYAWEHARRIAATDETVDLTGDGLAYEPYKATAEPVVPEAEPVEAARSSVGKAARV